MITSNYTTLLKDEIISLMAGGSLDYDAAGNLLVLTTDVPADAAYTSVAGFGYADVPVALGDWSPPTQRTGSNAGELLFDAVSNAGAPAAVAYQVQGLAIERATSGDALYTGPVQNAYSLQHGDQWRFQAASITINNNNRPLVIGDALINAVYNATLRGQTITGQAAFYLEFTQNAPSSGADTVLSIPQIEIPANGANWAVAAAASTFLSESELKKYGFDADARATANILELQTGALAQDYPEIGGWRIVTGTGNIWWRGALDPAKYVYEDATLKVLPNAIVLAI